MAFTAYMRRHQIESALFFAAYGDRKVQDVKRSLAVRREVLDFALSAQGMSAEALHAAFKERFTA
jgi:hypothetical protein